LKIKTVVVLAISIILTGCYTPSKNPPVAPSLTIVLSNRPTEITENSVVSTQVGCTLPPILVSASNVRYFYWSDNSEWIFYKEQFGQIWYKYNTISGQTNPITTDVSVTPTIDYKNFSINNYKEAFVSPNHELILFTRGTPEKYDVYYKKSDDTKESYLGTIHGNIKTIDWVDNKNQAIIAMGWQAPVYPDAYVYLVDFSKNELAIEIPLMNDYNNIEYLGLTPDENQLMFVSYIKKDRTVKLWDILTNEIVSTPIFNPLSFKWVNEDEFISTGYQNPDLFPLISVTLYNIKKSEMTYLADAKFNIEPHVLNALTSPDGSSVAYIENKTNNLYWTECIH
jgi:WD40 repeat protein